MDSWFLDLLLGDAAQDVRDGVVDFAFVLAHEVEEEGHFGGEF